MAAIVAWRRNIEVSRSAADTRKEKKTGIRRSLAAKTTHDVLLASGACVRMVARCRLKVVKQVKKSLFLYFPPLSKINANLLPPSQL